jgi:hypothetical protein
MRFAVRGPQTLQSRVPRDGRRVRVGPDPDAHPRRDEGRQGQRPLRGKKPKLSPSQERHLEKLYEAGEHTSSQLAELFNVARSTVYRAVERNAANGVALEPVRSQSRRRPPSRRPVTRSPLVPH